MTEEKIYPISDLDLKQGGSPFRLDNSTRTLFEDCPRKYYWSARGYITPRKPAYFPWGQAWHTALALWHRGEGFEKAESAALEYLQKENTAQIGDTVHTGENLSELLRRYVEYYPSEAWVVLGDEVGFEWPLPEKGSGKVHSSYSYTGSIDAYIEWPPYGKLIREDKSTGIWLSDSYLEQFKHSSQIDGYIWYMQEFLGEEIFGVLMNTACKKIAKAGKTPLFSRDIQRRNPEQLSEFLIGVGESFLRLEHYWETWSWPRTTNPIQCVGGIGRSQCPYKSLCCQPVPFTEINPLDLGLATRDKEWKPWERWGQEGE